MGGWGLFEMQEVGQESLDEQVPLSKNLKEMREGSHLFVGEEWEGFVQRP